MSARYSTSTTTRLPTVNEPTNRKPNLPIVGRGSSLKPKNRFESIELTEDWEQLTDDEVRDNVARKVNTLYLDDDSRTIVSQNNSPDLDFNYSLNPYRGCSHGCSYCYARPSHEYLGMNAGVDFESKIIVKRDAAKRFRKWLLRDNWDVEPVMMSGITDCYQGCEKHFGITGECIQVAEQLNQPLRLITKNSLIVRDLDLLTKLAARNLVEVTLSETSLDQSLTRVMEPRTSAPNSRLKTIGKLAKAGIPVRVLLAPIIPGLNDSEIPSLIKAVADAGAQSAGYVVLRLPQTVEPVFIDWLEQHFPDRKSKVLERVRSLGNGKIYDSNFATRMKGQGIWADQIRQLFNASCRKNGLHWRERVKLRTDLFRKTDANGRSQLDLF